MTQFRKGLIAFAKRHKLSDVTISILRNRKISDEIANEATIASFMHFNDEQVIKITEFASAKEAKSYREQNDISCLRRCACGFNMSMFYDKMCEMSHSVKQK